MNEGSGINRSIIEYDRGPNNQMHIIDPSKYNVPAFSSSHSKTYYTIQFKSGQNYIGISNN
jgi:hypothetical protein